MGSKVKIQVYLEVGRQRTFAGAIDWPGWCRSGRDEPGAVAALLESAPRYGRVLRPFRLGFPSPVDAAALSITQRLKGTATTDFGAPDRAPASDSGRVPPVELRRLQTILRACWRAFDTATQAAAGKTLRKGPRGGGRDLEPITRHVLEAEAAYLSRLGQSYKVGDGDSTEELQKIRRAVLRALAATAPLGTPPPGPRGGARWSPRYFVRRVAWHALDHAWELEDRMEGSDSE
jgi:hypothetical protein